jgi:hypothetical protein
LCLPQEIEYTKIEYTILCKEEARAAEASVCQKASTHFQKGERTNWRPNVGGVCVCVCVFLWPCLQRQGKDICVYIFILEYSSFNGFLPLGNNIRSIFYMWIFER